MSHLARARIGQALVILLATALPAVAAAQTVCEMLIEGTPASVPSTPVAVPGNPDISHLYIQVRTTRPLKSLVAGVLPSLVHKCAVASDLTEVDVMMEDVGFVGYSGSNVPLLTNAYIEHVGTTAQQQLLRDVVVAILDPAGNADPLMQNLKGDASLYNPAVLNVYYVHFDVVSLGSKDKELLESFTGMHIRNEQGESDRMIFISEGARADTVAHEFAHAFSAGHVNFWDFDGEEWCTKFLPHPETTDPGEEMEDMTCEFSRHNYMWAASELDRDRLGIPQGERMMYNQKSIIADFSVGPKQLDCPDYSNDIGVAADPDDDCKRLVGF